MFFERQNGHRRIATYTQRLSSDWRKFDLLDLRAEILRRDSFRKNIFTDCSVFGPSVFAKVAGNGRIIEFLKSPERAEFPSVVGRAHVFATDGSVTKIAPKKFRGSFAIVDHFNRSFISSLEFEKKPSSTQMELAAIRKLFSSLSTSDIQPSTIVILVDSLSAIKLTLGLDVRNENLEELREIDKARKILHEKDVRDIFLHVRSHRNIPVKLNREADRHAGLFSFLEGDDCESEKCSHDCSRESPCQACQWNLEANIFLRSLNPTPLELNIWSPI